MLAASSGHTLRSPASTRPHSQSISRQEASLLSCPATQTSSAAWPLKTSPLQSDQLGHFERGKKAGSVTFSLSSAATGSGSALEICRLNSEELCSAPAFPQAAQADRLRHQEHSNPGLISQRLSPILAPAAQNWRSLFSTEAMASQ